MNIMKTLNIEKRFFSSSLFVSLQIALRNYTRYLKRITKNDYKDVYTRSKMREKKSKTFKVYLKIKIIF